MSKENLLKEAQSYYDFFHRSLHAAAAAATAVKSGIQPAVTIEQHLADAADHWKSYQNLKKRASRA